MPNEPTLFSRRAVLKTAAACATYSAFVGYLEHEAERDGVDPVSTFIGLSRDFGSADEVASKFMIADTASLMASYAVFFPRFLEQHGIDSVELLEVAADKQKQKTGHKKDSHRLDALPAVAAAHLMENAIESKTRHKLSQYVLHGLQDPRREVREIVLQNLVTSVAPNFDSLRYFSVEPSVVDQIREILKEALDNEKLMSPALLCTEFLLNARASLEYRGAPKNVRQPYAEAIKYAQRVKAPHMQYLPTLIRLHGEKFKASPNDIESLPPQSSEALMGWRKLSQQREYLSLLALSRARLTYTIFRTASGKLAPDAAMSTEEAKRALPKIVGFFKAFDIQPLLQGSSVIDLVSANEPEFAKFLSLEFGELLRVPEEFGISLDSVGISPQMIALKDHVPFAKFTKESLFTRGVQDEKNAEKAICSGVRQGFATLGISGAGALIALLLGEKARAKRLKPEALEEARAEIATREKAIDEGKYKGIDQQQATIGDVDISRLSASPEGKGRSA